MRVLFITIMCLAFTGVKGQEVLVKLYGNQVFADRFDSYYDRYNYYHGKLKGTFQAGGGIEYRFSDYSGVELLYLRSESVAPTTYLFDNFNAGLQTTDFDVALNYVMLAHVNHFNGFGEKIDPYAGAMLGAMIAEIYNPDLNRESGATKFAWGLRGGIILWPTDFVGINLQGQLLSAVQAMGSTLYFGTGGAGAGVSSYSTIYQFSLGGGLVFKLSK